MLYELTTGARLRLLLLHNMDGWYVLQGDAEGAALLCGNGLHSFVADYEICMNKHCVQYEVGCGMRPFAACLARRRQQEITVMVELTAQRRYQLRCWNGFNPVEAST